MLELKHVKKTFSENSANNEVLRDVSLTVHDGDVIAIIGPSGSGKTTLLRAASYLTRADGGSVILDGEEFDLSRISGKNLLRYRKKIGFVFQSYNLFANKTAIENVTAALTIARKTDKNKAYEIAGKALEKVGMLEYKDYYPSRLSGGQQQRVAIARAMAPNPSVIFFDEPTSALDPELTGEVLNVMKKLADEGTTMMVVTHEMEFARRVANRVIFMENGVIVEENEAGEFFKNPRKERTIEFLNGLKWSQGGM